MAKEARGQYINGEAVYYRDDNTRKMVSQDAFSEIKKYAIGDYCIYENILYKFVADKEAGAWDVSAVETVTITGELKKINNNINVNEEIDIISSQLNTTNSQLNSVISQLNGLSFVKCTQDEYDNMNEHPNTILYFIQG